MTEAEPQNASSMHGRTIAGRYTIRATIGSGGMGFVYRAVQAPIEREVALKVLRIDLAHQEGIAERFSREARAASRIQHPNAITIYEFGEDDGILYLAMELLYGETLRQRLRREPPLEPEHALDIFEAMAGALAAAHAKGVIHRDLKPDNIFLAQFEGHGEVVKVLDFGLAKLLDRGGDAEGVLTDVNLRLGTPRYMAPEQAYGQQIDARCDVYALGLLLFEMLAGRAPFVAEDGMEVLAQRLKRPAPRLSEVAPQRGYSEALDAFVASLLERDRDHRQKDANEVLARIRELRRSGQVYGELGGPTISEGESELHDGRSPYHLPPAPAGAPRVRRTAPVTGYPVASNPGLAPVPSRPAPVPEAAPGPQQLLDDFDKPTVVITNREERSPSGPRALDPTPLQPQPTPSTSLSGSLPPPTLRQRPLMEPLLSRRLVVALLLIAIGAPLLALAYRWYRANDYRVEPMPEAQVPEPPRAAETRTTPAVVPLSPGPPRAADGQKGPAGAARPEEREVPEGRPKNCRIRLDSNPPGAKVERDGQVVGKTPMLDSMPWGTVPMRYRVTLPGYEPYEKSVVPDHRRTLNITLKPARDGKGRPPLPTVPF